MKAIRYFLLPLLLCLASCQPSRRADGTDSRHDALLAEAARDTDAQHFDAAMEDALQALALAGDAPRLKVQALSTIVGIDIMASRDADAWEKALEAEAIARENGLREELAGLLISKAKLCSYAEISPETGRNDEGLEYAQEALALAEETGAFEQQAEACYVIASLYINKNRWSDPIDPELYRTAGAYLDKGQALADTFDIPRLKRNGILFRSRWFQQGDRNEEAIQYFTQVFATLGETDYLTAASLDDRLVSLYGREGRYEDALATHEDYVWQMQKYLQQKQDETLQEMETRFEVQEKERALERRGYQVTLLLMALLLAAAVILIAINYLRRARRRNAELLRINDTKEQLIALLSHDLRNPASAYSAELEQLSVDAAALSADQIRERCQAMARDAQSINEDVAHYVGDILIERGRMISDIGLSKREIEIIRLSAEGLSAAEIADRTFLSVHTVNTHRQRIYAKMDVHNVSELLHKAQQLGII